MFYVLCYEKLTFYNACIFVYSKYKQYNNFIAIETIFFL